MNTNTNTNTESKIHDVTKAGAQLAKDAKKTFEDKIEPLKEEAVEYYEKGKSELKKAGKNLTQRIQANPTKSVLVAAGIGLVFGMFCRK